MNFVQLIFFDHMQVSETKCMVTLKSHSNVSLRNVQLPISNNKLQAFLFNLVYDSAESAECFTHTKQVLSER